MTDLTRFSITKKKRPSRHFESNLQIACVRWFRYQYQPIGKLLFAIPNGGVRTKRNASTLKAEGVLAGVSDLFLAVPMNGYHGLFMELKWGKNILTHEQREFLDVVETQRYRAIVIRSYDEFKAEIESYLKK